MLYAASIDFYSALLKDPALAHFDPNSPYYGLWGLNRTRIVTANGVQTLTIPLEKPVRGKLTPLRDLRISTHGHWERIHYGALYSGYGKSPFFEYLQDDIQHLYEQRPVWLMDFNLAFHHTITDMLDLGRYIPPTADAVSTEGLEERIREHTQAHVSVPYYQVWQDRYGFIPHLSILDMLFNVGREAILYLNKERTE